MLAANSDGMGSDGSLIGFGQGEAGIMYGDARAPYNPSIGLGMRHLAIANEIHNKEGRDFSSLQEYDSWITANSTHVWSKEDFRELRMKYDGNAFLSAVAFEMNAKAAMFSGPNLVNSATGASTLGSLIGSIIGMAWAYVGELLADPNPQLVAPTFQPGE